MAASIYLRTVSLRISYVFVYSRLRQNILACQQLRCSLICAAKTIDATAGSNGSYVLSFLLEYKAQIQQLNIA